MLEFIEAKARLEKKVKYSASHDTNQLIIERHKTKSS